MRKSAAALIGPAFAMLIAGIMVGALVMGLGTMAAEALARMEGEASGGILRWIGALLWGVLNVAAVAPGAFTDGILIGACVGGACAILYLLAAVLGRISSAPPPLRWTILPGLGVAGAVGGALGAAWQAAEPMTWYVAGGALYGLAAGYTMDKSRRETEGADARVRATAVRKDTNRSRGALVGCTLLVATLGVAAVTFVPWQRVAAVPGTARTVLITPNNAVQVVQLAQVGSGETRGTAFSSGGEMLAAATSNGVNLVDVVTLNTAHRVETGPVAQVALRSDDAMLATALESMVQLWNVAGGTLAYTLSGPTETVTDLAFSRDGRFVAASSVDGAAYVWRVSDGTRLYAFNHLGELRSLDFRADGQELVTGSGLGITIWQLTTGSRLRVIATGFVGANVVRYTPDGETLVVALSNGTIQYYKTTDYAQVRRAAGVGGPIWATALSPDGQVLASGSNDMRVRLWRVSDGTLLGTLSGHVGAVTDVAFSPEGRLLATTGTDGVTRLWGLPGDRGSVGVTATPTATRTPTTRTPTAVPTTTGAALPVSTEEPCSTPTPPSGSGQ